ncbi:MAG TPA: MarR family winged helix-turn-helix transcriptional regulator [Tepidisphaeraceae bacterium]|jgi:MarR family transcriptional regulator for hemolysin
MPASAEQCASQLLDVIPRIMQTFRREMRSRRSRDLSIPQFRTLAFLHHHPDGSLSDVAEHIGLTLPTMSKMIDALVARGLMTRRLDAADRRRVQLALTPHGQSFLAAVRQEAQQHLAATMEKLTPPQRQSITAAMSALRTAFAPAESQAAPPKNREKIKPFRAVPRQIHKLKSAS